MGETEGSIFVIGSPDIDIMKSDTLPTLEEAKKRYAIPFDEFAIFIYHPITTKIADLKGAIMGVVSALIDSGRNYLVIYPNNDKGSDIILEEYKRFDNRESFRVFPSMRFESFLKLLQKSSFIIGNSSAGVREAEVYGVPAINIGGRQKNRTRSKNVVNVSNNENGILKAIGEAEETRFSPISHFGDGDSYKRFYEVITRAELWDSDVQKQFSDLDF
jgi:UDP-N-acetylglucosamine 2-epimerase (hydrolysing)